MLASGTTNPGFSVWFPLPVYWSFVLIFVVNSLTEVTVLPFFVPKTTCVAKHDVLPALLCFPPERGRGRMAEVADSSTACRRPRARFDARFQVAVALFRRIGTTSSFGRDIRRHAGRIPGSNIYLRQDTRYGFNLSQSRIRASLVRAVSYFRSNHLVRQPSRLGARPRPLTHPATVSTPPRIRFTHLPSPSTPFLAPSSIFGSAAGAIPSTRSAACCGSVGPAAQPTPEAIDPPIATFRFGIDSFRSKVSRIRGSGPGRVAGKRPGSTNHVAP